MSSRLHEISCPALLMWGELDQSLPRDRMDLLADQLQATTGVRVVGGAAHSPPLTHPGQVTPLVEEFLAALTGSRR